MHVHSYAKQHAIEHNPRWRDCSVGFSVIVVSIQSLLWFICLTQFLTIHAHERYALYKWPFYTTPLFFQLSASCLSRPIFPKFLCWQSGLRPSDQALSFKLHGSTCIVQSNMCTILHTVSVLQALVFGSWCTYVECINTTGTQCP